MANKNLKTVTTRPGRTATPQSQKAVKGQKKNNAGGYTFTVSDLDRAKRFLILGSDKSYYQSGAKLSKKNAENLIKIAESDDSQALTDLIVEISTGGRAAKQDPGLFALAIVASHGADADRSYALSKLAEVARTGSSLFTFITYVEQFRGWGTGLKRAVAEWYTEKSADQIAYQAAKYRQREGWTHRDVFRKAHPKKTIREQAPDTDPEDNLFIEVHEPEFSALGEWILRGVVSENLPALIKDFEKAQTTSVENLPALIRESKLTWEMLPTSVLNDKDVWEALLEGNVPLGALIRQLPRLTRIGVLGVFDSGTTQKVSARLKDPKELAKARIHPINILVALKTYSSGRSEKGSSTWTPLVDIVDALDKAFYASFKTVEPAGKNTLIGLDVSGSMGIAINGSNLSARDVSAAFALVIKATEPSTHIIGFTGGGWYGRNNQKVENVTALNISPSQRLDDVVKKISNLPFGSTDCALPMLYALEKGLEVDTFVIITDNETWAGHIHPHEALQKYRAATGIDAKLIVLATDSTGFTIADPKDPLGQLDIAGFDSAVPSLVTEFSRGL